jgi:hypothetical protein
LIAEARMQEELRIHRQILYDLAVHYLEPLPGNFARLAYLSSLRNVENNTYVHERLAAVYGREAVHQTLSKCHEELLERLLELSLAQQEDDLRRYVNTWVDADASSSASASVFENPPNWVSPNSPGYLRELFQANLSALLALLAEGKPTARSNT